MKISIPGPTFLILGLFGIFSPTLFIVFLCVIPFVILHEIGHGLIAKKYGYQPRGITILPIGAAIYIPPIKKHTESMMIALAGPCVNFTIFFILAPIYIFFPNDILYFFCMVNLVLAVFNLFPVFPLDGGRILNAVLGHYKVYHQNKIMFIVGCSICLICIAISLYYSLWWFLMIFLGLIIFNFFFSEKYEITV